MSLHLSDLLGSHCDEAAALHAAAIADLPVAEPWTAAMLRRHLAAPEAIGLAALAMEPSRPALAGWILARVAADEAEIVDLCVAPPLRRRGIATRLLETAATRAARAGARRLVLEAATMNAPALALYRTTGFSVVGHRAGYYRGPDGRTADAVVMARPLAESGFEPA